MPRSRLRAPSSRPRRPRWASPSARIRATRRCPTASPRRSRPDAMSWTKRQLAADALGSIGIADYEFDVTPDEQLSVIRRLDAMMATWEARGVRVGYLFPATAD